MKRDNAQVNHVINILLNVYSPKRMWTRSWSSSGLLTLRGLRKTHFPICSSLVKRISSKALAYDLASLACTLRRLCPLYCVGRGMIHGRIHMWSYMYMAIGNVCRRLQVILSQHKKQSFIHLQCTFHRPLHPVKNKAKTNMGV